MEYLRFGLIVLFGIFLFGEKFTLAIQNDGRSTIPPSYNFPIVVSNDSPIFCGDVVHINVKLINKWKYMEYKFQLLGDEVIQKKFTTSSRVVFTYNTPGYFCNTIELNVTVSYQSEPKTQTWTRIALNQTKIFINGIK